MPQTSGHRTSATPFNMADNVCDVNTAIDHATAALHCHYHYADKSHSIVDCHCQIVRRNDKTAAVVVAAHCKNSELDRANL